jgi:putative aldouronate transport system permease protein
MTVKNFWKRKTPADLVFECITVVIIFFVIIVTSYPFMYILSSSISESGAVARMEIWLLPKGINFDAYKRVFNEPQLGISYLNTLWYVVVGTGINVFMTTFLAYPLSRRRFQGRRFIMKAVTFTMFFSGGMVPTFILVRSLGMMNTRWAVIIPTAISTYNLIITRTFFESIPASILEMATIDGAGDLRIFFRIVLPLSMPILATLVLFYAVSHWNSYFNAMLYLSRERLYPLQLFLRKILLQFETNTMTSDVIVNKNSLSQTIRYATIMISTLPIICAYPFLQKYFIKGVMIGAVKG